MKKWLLSFTFPILAIGIAFAGMTYSDKVISWASMGYDNTETIDLQDYSRFSLQAIYSTPSLSADTVTDGTKATTDITVTYTSNLTATKASQTVEIATTTGLSGESVTLNGIVFTAGTDFAVGASSTTSAANLTVVVNAHPYFLATSAGSTMTVTAADFGTAPNAWPVATSDASIIAVGGATFSGGTKKECIDFWGLSTLCEDDDFDVATSSDVTAGNIKDAIDADTDLSALVVASTDSKGVVTLTQIAPAYVNYYIQSTTSAFSVTNNALIGGGASDIVSSVITESAHGYQTGVGLLFAVGSGTAPQNLVDGTTYYAIVLNDNTYSVASSTTNAIAGTAITISTFTGSGSFTMTPLALSGTPSFKWQASNDNSNWTDLALTSVTYSSAGNSLWDVGEVDYRYIRINYVAPTEGGMALDVWLAGKRD